MPSSLLPRNDHHAVMYPPFQFGTENEIGSVIHYRGLISAREASVPPEVTVESSENSDEDLDELADIGVNGREGLGAVSEESPQDLALATNYPVRQDPIEIRQQEEGKAEQTRRDVIEYLQRKGQDISTIQTAIDKIWSETPNAILTSESIHQEIQRLQQQPPAQELPGDVVMVGDGLNNEDMKKLKLENQRLRERNICKVCLLADIDIAFFPCGHQLCCAGCFSTMKSMCDLCKRHIAYGLVVQTVV